MIPVVVGFDLDMTLIDPRRGVRAALDLLAAETGKPIDVDHIVEHLGPPLETALAPWFSGSDLDAACWRYRDFAGDTLVHTDAMPGAVAAVRAVRSPAPGGPLRRDQAIVVTAKYEPHAKATLEVVGIEVDAVIGWRFGPAKGETLSEFGAAVYVGDHPADVAGARVAGALSVCVTTGHATAEELWDAGADVVLPSLLAFPGWWAGHLASIKEW